MYRTIPLLCLLGLATSALAQDSLKGEVFGGYTYTPSNFSTFPNGENGWVASVAGNINRWVSLKADFAQYRATYSIFGFNNHNTSTTFLFGPQVTIPLRERRVKPFGEFLIGGVHVHDTDTLGQDIHAFQSDTTFLWAFGGGVDLQLTRHLWLRGEGDYLHNHFTTNDNQVQSFVKDSRARIVTGLVFRF